MSRDQHAVNLRGQVEEDFVDTRLLDTLDGRSRKDILNHSEDPPGFEPVRVKRNLVGLDVREAVISILPFALALAPGRDVLAYELWADFLGVSDVGVAVEAEFAGGVVDRDKTLPLLHGEGLRVGEGEADLLALCVEGVEVDVRDAAERAVRGGLREEGEVAVGEAGFAAGAGAGRG